MAEVEQPLVVIAPGLEVHESFIEIIDLASGKRVVTVIEVLSPTNKLSGPGRESYLAKQRHILESQSHLVEIDLLRAGLHVLSVPRSLVGDDVRYDYLVCVNRANRRVRAMKSILIGCASRSRGFAFRLPTTIPTFRWTCRSRLLKTMKMRTTATASTISSPRLPSLSEEDQAWASELIRKSALR